MKRKIKYLLIFTFLLGYLFFLFKDNQIIVTNIINTTNIFFTKVLPSLFPIFIANELLLTYNFPYYLCKLLRTNNVSLYVLIMSLISGTPSNAIIIDKLVKNKTISTNYGSYLLLFSYFSSPLFLITMLQNIFQNYAITVKIIVIHYLSNLIVYLFTYKKNNIKIKYINNHNGFSTSLIHSLKNSIYILINVFSIIIFFSIISTIIVNNLNLNNISNILVSGLLEITQGLNKLSLININLKLKEIISLIIISFGGLSIHLQVKSIIRESHLNYLNFFIGRILQTIISIILILII